MFGMPGVSSLSYWMSCAKPGQCDCCSACCVRVRGLYGNEYKVRFYVHVLPPHLMVFSGCLLHTAFPKLTGAEIIPSCKHNRSI